ncbi:MAG: hypothetical protein Tsb009_27880 [Planctomycetaceae bacterium]
MENPSGAMPASKQEMIATPENAMPIPAAFRREMLMFVLKDAEIEPLIPKAFDKI